MQYQLLSLSEVLPSSLPKVLDQISQIFFETSTRKVFATSEEKSEFEYRYLGIYLKNPQHQWIALNPANQQVLGYLTSALQTTEEHYQLNPYLELFRSSIDSLYPAHLHIDFAPEAQGKGIGSALLSRFETDLRLQQVKGVHLITSTQSRNVSFYEKNHYSRIQEAIYKNTSLVLFAKLL